MAVNGIEIKEGQVWKDRLGRIVTIKENPGASDYIWRAIYESGHWNTITNRGMYFCNHQNCDADIVELIRQPKEENNQLINIYSENDIRIACNNLKWQELSCDYLIEELNRIQQPDYQEYLRLKAKFEKE